MSEYSDLLEDEIFKGGEQKGRLRTALTVLTDMLIELNSLEVFYQKPASKAITPPEIQSLRKKISVIKDLVHSSIKAE